jgi:CNP1-like family
VSTQWARWVALAPILLLMLAAPQRAQAQWDWQELESVQPPAAVAQSGLIAIEMPVFVSLRYELDPTSLRIDQDGVVRYVVVATSASGVRNVFFEGVRCKTSEFKTYARMQSDGRWTAVQQAQWRSVYETTVSRHVRNLLRQGMCKGPLPGASTVRELTDLLRNGEQRHS